MFTPNEMQQRVRKQPFVPLRIVTSSGESFDVFHPEMILIGQRDVQIGESSREDSIIYEQVNRVSIMHITAMKDLPARKRRNGDGPGRKES